MLAIMLAVFIFTIVDRTPLELDIIRDRGELYHTTNEGLIENIYTLKVLNMSQQRQTYQISVRGADSITLSGNTQLEVAPGELVEVLLRAQVDPAQMSNVNIPIEFIVSSNDQRVEVSEESRFIGPRIR